jgi:hypothetical protein
MPTYINPTSRPVSISCTHEGKRIGGTVYPFSVPRSKLPGDAITELLLPASRGAEFVKMGMLAIKDAHKTDPVVHAPPIAEPVEVSEPPQDEEDDLIVDPSEPSEEPVDPDKAAEDARKAEKKATFMERIRRGKENAAKVRAAEAAVKAEAEAKSKKKVKTHPDEEDVEEDDADDLIVDPADPSAAEVAKEETKKIVAPRRRFVVRNDD